MFAEFLEKYPPEGRRTKPEKRFLAAANQLGIPKELQEFWKTYGFGSHGNGFIKMINPEDYTESLYTWLGGVDFTRLPVMMTAFGDLIYFRSLGEGAYDLSLLDIHHRGIDVCTYTLEELVSSYLLNEEVQAAVLKKDLFLEAQPKVGALAEDEIYFFVPALILGGSETIDQVDKGDAATHQMILFQMGN